MCVYVCVRTFFTYTYIYAHTQACEKMEAITRLANLLLTNLLNMGRYLGPQNDASACRRSKNAAERKEGKSDSEGSADRE